MSTGTHESSTRSGPSPPAGGNRSVVAVVKRPVAPYRPQLAEAPPGLPNPDLAFDVAEKKLEIFDQVRDAVRASAQHTKYGRKPWTHVTVRLPVAEQQQQQQQQQGAAPGNEGGGDGDEDLAVVWRLMHRAATVHAAAGKVNARGDRTWHMSGPRFLSWLLGDDAHERLLPAEKYVHPVLYDTGELERKRLARRLTKEGPSAELEGEMWKAEEAAASKAERPRRRCEGYVWADYDECVVIYKRKQPRREKYSEIQLTVKVRTCVAGYGDPAQNRGYMNFSNNPSNMDPDSEIYSLTKDFL